LGAASVVAYRVGVADQRKADTHRKAADAAKAKQRNAEAAAAAAKARGDVLKERAKGKRELESKLGKMYQEIWRGPEEEIIRTWIVRQEWIIQEGTLDAKSPDGVTPVPATPTSPGSAQTEYEQQYPPHRMTRSHRVRATAT